MNNIVKYSFLMLFLVLVSCAKKTVATDMVAGASFGVVNSRIQFYKVGASKMKYSPTATAYDDISGATYTLKSADTNSLTYEWEGQTLKVVVIDNDSVDVILPGITNTFSPRAINLGKRP
ncbi:MAG: hypothetical protein ACRC0X_06585 [Brevinema sp.]